MLDIVVLTQKEYLDPKDISPYIANILEEDRLLTEALAKVNIKTKRVAWDDPSFDWSTTKFVLIRAIWDYQDRFQEFSKWLSEVKTKTTLLNSANTVHWNIDKHYLKDLSRNGVHIAPTRFIEPLENITLKQLFDESGWQEAVLKPCISAGGRDTYRINANNINPEIENRFQELIKVEAMMLQPFLKSIITKGEVSLMVMDGKFTHAVLKKAKTGEFRIQDDHGGTVHEYIATKEEKEFAENTIRACYERPIYARVDIIEDNDGKLSLAEIELVEPELWFRYNHEAATILANGIKKLVN